MKYDIELVVENMDFLEDDAWGFYDWFCKDSALERRAKAFRAKLAFLLKEELVNGRENYVWFKNNALLSGAMYDDCRISSLDEDNDFLGGFYSNGGGLRGGALIWMLDLSDEDKASVEGLENWEVEGNVVQFYMSSWSGLKKELKSNEKLRSLVRKNFRA